MRRGDYIPAAGFHTVPLPNPLKKPGYAFFLRALEILREDPRDTVIETI
jgi:hypothetical protein